MFIDGVVHREAYDLHTLRAAMTGERERDPNYRD